ncbi:MAG: radical SAM protein [Patescibacteria group bacterium]|nr:radical SAM protein [Patescibacteria group bacterium]
MQPKDAVLALTYKCNSRCVMCNIWQQPVSLELQPLDYQKLPTSLQDINLSGGEPFLRADLFEIIQNILKINPKVRIIISTNGLAPELIQQQIKKIIKIKPDIGVAVSLDGIGQKHEEIRRIPQAYEKVLSTIQVLKQAGVQHIKLAFTGGDYNIDQLMPVYELSLKLNIEFTLAIVHQSDHYFQTDIKIQAVDKFKKPLQELIQRELKIFSPKRWLRAYFTYGLYYLLKKQQRLLPNYSGLKSFYMDPPGNVYPSDVSDFQMGNLIQDNLKQIFNNKKETQIFKQVNQSERPNWMICTARSAIKKHPFRVILWILKAKLFGAKLK